MDRSFSNNFIIHALSLVLDIEKVERLWLEPWILESFILVRSTIHVIVKCELTSSFPFGFYLLGQEWLWTVNFASTSPSSQLCIRWNTFAASEACRLDHQQGEGNILRPVNDIKKLLASHEEFWRLQLYCLFTTYFISDYFYVVALEKYTCAYICVYVCVKYFFS